MTTSSVSGHESRSMHVGAAATVSQSAVGSDRRKWSEYSMAHVAVLALAIVAAISQNAFAGWTEFLPSSDTRIIYVSNSQGNDNNSGLTPQDPVKTVQAGFQKLRHGYPDWLLLRRGDSWVNNSFGSSTWNKSGRSESEPMRMGAYGSSPDRPLLLYSGDGFVCHHSRSHVAITGIHFKSSNGGNDGVRMLIGYGENWLFEDCVIEGFQNNMNIQGFGTPGELHNLRVRRCIVIDAASPGGGHSQGIFAAHIHGMLIEENVIDSNGWSQNTNPGGAGYPTVFNHNMYFTTSITGAVVRGNIVSEASSHGIQLRSGGIIEDNVFTRNPLGILLGGGDPDPNTHTYGVTGHVRNNVVLEGRDINANNPRGFGIDVANIASGTVENNIVANAPAGNQPRPLSFLGAGYGSGVGVQNMVASDNIIFNWRGGVEYTGSNIGNLTFKDNDVQNPNSHWVAQHSSESSVTALTAAGNRWHTNASNGQWVRVSSDFHTLTNWLAMIGDTTSTNSQVNYPDPNRTIGTYNVTLGGANSHEAFMAEARMQSRANWRPQYTAEAVRAYIRAGFGLN